MRGSLTIIVALTFWYASPVKGAELMAGIGYRIRSGLDGSILTAQYPKYADDLKLQLGVVTTQGWNGDGKQLWFVNRRLNSNETWFTLRPKKAVLNALSGLPDKHTLLKINEVTVNSGTFTVKNEENMCLENQGLGLPVVWNKNCYELNTAQHWDFEDPQNLNLLKLFSQLLQLSLSGK